MIVDGDKTWEPIRITTTAGETVNIDASASVDPDGDKLGFDWFQYKEVGSIQNEVSSQARPGQFSLTGELILGLVRGEIDRKGGSDSRDVWYGEDVQAYSHVAQVDRVERPVQGHA